ncbi:MAG TPA: extracellular solute-binding protein, partial [Stellaceae bacterium]|nr:extracellular solute-binding protein [Stellaceae bacterium]
FRRRTVLGALGAAATMSMLGAAPARAGEFDGTTLRVGTWGGSWRDSLEKTVGTKVEARGAKIEYVLDSPTGNAAKLIAARGRAAPLDNMEGAPDLAPSLIEAKLIEKLDLSQLPNAKSLLPFARGDYAVITLATLDGVVYNTAKFQEIGLPAPKGYRDLINDKLAGRVAFPDINHTQHWNAVVGLAYEAGGNEVTLTKAIDLINQMKPAYFYATSTDLATKFGSGEIWAAPWHAGFVVRLKRTGLPVAIAYTHFGPKYAALWPVLHHIVSGTKSTKAAEAFLDAYLSPDAQFEHSKFTGSLPMNPDARSRLSTDPENKDILMFSDQELNGAFLVDFTKVDLPKWREAWARDIKRT